MIKSTKDLEKAVSKLLGGETIKIDTLPLTHDANIRLRHYIADGVLIPTKDMLDCLSPKLENSIKSGNYIPVIAEYTKAYSAQYIADSVESSFTPIMNHYIRRDIEQCHKIDELETQLLQYQAYVADTTTAIQKNICKDFCPNIKPVTCQEKGGIICQRIQN